MAINEATLVKTNFTDLTKRFTTYQAIYDCAFEYYAITIGALIRALNEVDNDPQTSRSDAIIACIGPHNYEKALGDTPDFMVDPSIRFRNKEITFLSIMSSLSIIHLFFIV